MQYVDRGALEGRLPTVFGGPGCRRSYAARLPSTRTTTNSARPLGDNYNDLALGPANGPFLGDELRQVSGMGASTSHSTDLTHRSRCNQSVTTNHKPGLPRLNRKQEVLVSHEHSAKFQSQNGECGLKSCAGFKRKLEHAYRCEGTHCDWNCIDFSEVSSGKKTGLELSFSDEPVTKRVKESRLEETRVEESTVEESSNETLTEDKVSGKRINGGASLLDTFTAEEIREHLRSLRRGMGQKETIFEPPALVDGTPDQNTCSLCGLEELLFAPPPRYCGRCAAQILSHGVYYVGPTENGTGNGNGNVSVPVSLCSRCFNAGGETIRLKTGDILKAFFEKRSNYAETDADSEWWVQCSRCESWQHQICALFNRKSEANAEYTCANCYLKEIKRGECEPLDHARFLGAKDLPRTRLSDHIEQWISARLETERKERAMSLGKSVQEVPGAEGLTVRVVSCLDRIAKVQPYFFEFLKEEGYPSEFPYKSKAILLFQKIEGVDVCLFAMYVQEYGSHCPLPNRRHVYISYIDSVKYFRPEIKSSTGEALRTFVYHEILIGYLDYCKKRGFSSCSLWACPPTKHDDYILYCHPATQKMPKAEKLRSWYQTMINTAIKEKVVAEKTNLYDYFLLPTNECRTNISSAHLPYCENDFWPGEAERILASKEKGNNNNNNNNNLQKKETEYKGRALRAAIRGCKEGKPDDIVLLHKLGERMRSLKEDFVLVFLQNTCKHCRRPIISDKKWICTSCKNFQLCDQCYMEEEDLPKKDQHPIGSKLKHGFHCVEEAHLPETDAWDPLMECEFFDSRIDLLRLCQSKMYQFDSLRRAKHSTMMILHHLHAPICSACHAELDADVVSWSCPVCSGYNLCDSCYRREGVSYHAHGLVRNGEHGKIYVRKLEMKNGDSIMQNMMDGLVHASGCGELGCGHRLCCRMKQLFRHGSRCVTRQAGGCVYCTRMWELLYLHSRYCTQSASCLVPRCRDIKDYITKQGQQSQP